MRVPIAFPKIPNLVYFEADFFSRRTHLVNQYIIKLIHRYISTLVHRYISTSVHRYISKSVHRYISTSVHHYIGTSVHRYIGTSVHRYIGKSVHHNNVTSPFRKTVLPEGSRYWMVYTYTPGRRGQLLKVPSHGGRP